MTTNNTIERVTVFDITWQICFSISSSFFGLRLPFPQIATSTQRWNFSRKSNLEWDALVKSKLQSFAQNHEIISRAIIDETLDFDKIYVVIILCKRFHNSTPGVTEDPADDEIRIANDIEALEEVDVPEIPTSMVSSTQSDTNSAVVWVSSSPFPYQLVIMAVFNSVLESCERNSTRRGGLSHLRNFEMFDVRQRICARNRYRWRRTIYYVSLCWA